MNILHRGSLSGRIASAFVAAALALGVAFGAVLGGSVLGAVFGVFVSPAYAATESPNLVDPTQAADNSFIYDTTVASLYSQASLYNDRTVQVVGEVIGDRIKAVDNQDWITLTETVATDKSSISVLMSFEQAEQVVHYGRYGVQGSTMQVRGTYHQACDEHDGLPDIHATNSSIVSRGYEKADTVSFGELSLGIVLVIVGVALMCLFYVARERTR